ncbi:MAG TPA: hypothetical protein VK798_01905 [Alloacidobacterium sp.]|jgi:chromosome segregation ATPase|nr:hypothetical protein [Alloacidobacterium sp.]
MSDETVVEQRSFSGAFLGLLAAAFLAAIGGLIWSYTLSNRLTTTETQLKQAQAQNDKLGEQLEQTNARLKVATETLGQSVGLTQKQLETRANDLLRRQEADAKRLEGEQAAAQKQIGAVSTDVSSVKTDVGGVKTDVAQTKTELQNTQAQLQSMKGDLGVQSGLIATNHDELEILKHKGDRNYYEFTLHKNQRQPISTVGLELKKADTKHSRYTLEVYADDKKIEKKDRGLNEPVQFYTGKDNYLYELVVNNMSKDQIQGYVSTPKAAPAPVNPGH